LRRLLTVAPVAVVAVGAVIMAALARAPEDQIAGGVRVSAVDLGGKSRAEALTALKQFAEQQKRVVVTLRLPAKTGIKHTWRANAAKLGLGIDTQATLDEAGKAGHEGVLGQVSSLLTGPKAVPVAAHPTVDKARLRAALKRIARAANRPAKNARLILLASGGFGHRHERSGMALDMDASIAAVTQAWSDFQAGQKPPDAPAVADGPPPAAPPDPDAHAKTPAPGTPPPTAPTELPPAGNEKSAKPESLAVTLAVKTVPAAVTFDDLKQIDGELGGFHTYFSGTGRSRGRNIALAASHINGTLLAPGEIFSYNKTVGPRSADAGFEDAPVIVHGELVPGVGGGVCQVSSTLYNAVLLSDLKIVRRSHHAFPVHYLPAGRDATVVDGAIDLQFQNSTPAPIYIAASSRGGRLSFRIFGKRTPGRDVSIELANHTTQPADTETIRDPSLPAGRRVVKSKGHRGHRVTVYRVVRENGKVVRRELISRDHYRPFPTVVLVGTKSRPHPVVRHKPSAPRPPAQPSETAPPPAVPNAPPAG
jgi:vancomycin resistance protein YoaR